MQILRTVACSGLWDIKEPMASKQYDSSKICEKKRFSCLFGDQTEENSRFHKVDHQKNVFNHTKWTALRNLFLNTLLLPHYFTLGVLSCSISKDLFLFHQLFHLILCSDLTKKSKYPSGNLFSRYIYARLYWTLLLWSFSAR